MHFSLVKLENELAGSKKLLADATYRINTLENELKFEKDKLNVEVEKRKKLQVCLLLRIFTYHTLFLFMFIKQLFFRMMLTLNSLIHLINHLLLQV